MWVWSVLMLWCMSATIWAATYIVDPNGYEDFTTIQAAIDDPNTGTGDIIQIVPGTYYVNVHGDPSLDSIRIDKDITLTSTGNDPNMTVIDGNDPSDLNDSNGSVIVVQDGGGDCVISSLTIQNGYAFWSDDNPINGYEPTGGIGSYNTKNCGGGICVELANSIGGSLYNEVSVYNCIIRDNHASVAGGGIFNVDGSILQCTIEGNSAGYIEGIMKSLGGGGGIAYCCDSGYATPWEGNIIENCVIQSNTAFEGGGLYECYGVKDSKIIENTTLHYENYSSLDGGAPGNPGYGSGLSRCWDIDNCLIQGNGVEEVRTDPRDYLFACGGGLFGCTRVKNCEIIGNSTQIAGGGFSECSYVENCVIACNEVTIDVTSRGYEGVGGGCYYTLSLTDCTITGNSAHLGGGLYECNADGCLISQNHAVSGGGAVDETAGVMSLNNCIISGNTATNYAGGVLSLARAIIENCTIVGNKAGINGGAAWILYDDQQEIAIKNCIIWDNLPSDYINTDSDDTYNPPEIQYSCFPAGSGNINPAEAHNITPSEPNFIDPGYWDPNGVWIEGDYHLNSNSPCIEVGMNWAVASNELDFDGNDRIVHFTLVEPNELIVDMGAYEVIDGQVATLVIDETEGTAPDLFGELNNGAFYDLNGHTQTALNLDGLNDYLEIENYTGVGGSTSRICAAWIKTDSTETQMIMSWGESVVDRGRAWMVAVKDDLLFVGVFGGTVAGTTAINDGQWHHIAVVLDGDQVSDIELYVDGEIDPSSITNGSTVINSSTDMNVTIGVRNYDGLQVGNETWYYKYHFNGLIDDVKIYDSSAFPQDPADEVKKLAGPKCHWAFDEYTTFRAWDQTVNSYHGRLHNFEDNACCDAITGVKRVEGKLNNALQFDGIDDYVEINNFKGISGSASRTCVAWVKTTSKNASIIMSWGNASAGEKWMFYLSGAGKLGVGVWGGYIEDVSSDPDNILNDGDWHHVVAVLPAIENPTIEDILLYVDETLVQNTYASSTQPINTEDSENVFIGARFAEGVVSPVYFDGSLDDVRIYDRALSSTQIEELHDMGNP